MLVDTRDRDFLANAGLVMLGCVVGGLLVGFAMARMLEVRGDGRRE